MGDETSHKVSQVEVRNPRLHYPLQSTMNLIPEARDMVPSHNGHHYTSGKIYELEATRSRQLDTLGVLNLKRISRIGLPNSNELREL